MASIDCAKYTSGQASGLAVHFDQDKRLELEHENPHIDKSKTHLNSFYDCGGYSDMLEKQRNRVAEADELHPPERVRKDRNTAIMMNIPVPKAISDQGLTDQFLKDTYGMIGDMVGKENMCGMTTHRDEIHEYIDHGGAKRTSLEHGHAMVVPYAHWKAKETVYGEDGKPIRDEHGKILKQEVEREGVNAKHFLTRNFLKKLQDRMQEMVLEKYGISYQTSQEPLRMSVEDLKRDSARAAAIIERAEQYAKETTEKTHEELSEARQELSKTQEGVNTLKEQEKALKGVREPYEAVKTYEALKSHMGLYKGSEVDKAFQKHLAFDTAQKELTEALRHSEVIEKDRDAILAEAKEILKENEQKDLQLAEKQKIIDNFSDLNQKLELENVRLRSMAKENELRKKFISSKTINGKALESEFREYQIKEMAKSHKKTPTKNLEQELGRMR